MNLIRHGRDRSLKKKAANKMELNPLVEPSEKQPVGKIFRCPTIVQVSGEDSRQGDEPDESSILRGNPGERSRRTTGRESNQRQASCYFNKLGESVPRFGPIYAIDQPSVEGFKKNAWEHVLSSFDQSSEGKETYSTAIMRVEKEAMEAYAETVSDTTTFRWMMIKDGCFFLQLALLILGCSKELGYPSNDPIFGRQNKKKDIKKWVESMFTVGNQIPLVVLNELMDQKFFQDVIAKVKWDPPPSSLCGKVLYELLVLPALQRSKSNRGPSLKEGIMGRGNVLVGNVQPCNLLHGLQNLVLGPGEPSYRHAATEYDFNDDDIDLEANEEDAHDDDEEEGISSANYARKKFFPCATELNQAGIKIKKLKNGGTRGIYFKSFYFWSYLYLPVFVVDENTEIIFKHLKLYELSKQQQSVGKNKREVSSYLRLMSDIIQTRKDVKLLEKRGIIQGNSYHAVKLPGILNRLNSEDITLTREFCILRRKIGDYSSPLVHYKGILNIVVFLTFLQTFFALLAYFHPPKQK